MDIAILLATNLSPVRVAFSIIPIHDRKDGHMSVPTTTDAEEQSFPNPVPAESADGELPVPEQDFARLLGRLLAELWDKEYQAEAKSRSETCHNNMGVM